MYYCLPLWGGVVYRSVYAFPVSLASVKGFTPQRPRLQAASDGPQHGSGPGLERPLVTQQPCANGSVLPTSSIMGKQPKHADTGDKDDSDNRPEPRWDSSLRNLRLYLIPLKRWLPRQHPQLNNFVGGSTAGWLAIVHFGSVGHLWSLFERYKAT